MFFDSSFAHRWRLLLVFLSFTFLSTAFVTQALSAPAELQLENELLLDLRLDGESLGQDILGYQRGADFLISLDELANGLGFAISVNGEQGSASGWYISEDRVFSLDIASATVVSGSDSWPVTEGEAVIFEGGLYVATQALQKWLPIQLDAVIRELYLDVVPTEKIPIQERLNRRNRVVARTSGYQEPQYPLLENPYKIFSPHITKLRITQSTTRQTPESSAEYSTNYASLSRGDLGWMTSTLSLAGQRGNSLSAARIKLERTAFDGPLGINHIEVGDVDAGGFRGFLLRGGGENKNKGGRFDNELVNIEGSQLPDWDVELYQNGRLVLILTTGPDGRYLFEDIPLLFGQNKFEIRFFGPNGETEFREEFHFLGTDMLAPGSISYEVSAVQSGRTVFGVNDVDGEAEQDSGIYESNVNLGLSRNLTAAAGVISEKKNGVRLESSNVGFNLSTSRAFASVRYLDASNVQNSLSTSLSTRLGKTNLNLGYTRFFDESALANSPQKWQSNADISSYFLTVPIKIIFGTNEQDNLTQRNAAIAATIPLSGLGRFSSSLSYSSIENRLNENASTTSRTTGQSSFYTTLRPWAFRLSANYLFSPESELLDLAADSSLRIDRDLSLDLSLRRNTITDTTFYAGGINWQLEQVAINASVSYDSDERWGGLITLSTALVHRPGTLKPRLDSRASVNAGSVEVRVYEDTERVIQPGVEVNGVQVWRRALTDKNGVAYLGNMPAHRQVDIELDESTLADSELKSKIPGVSIIPRPGSYSIVDFPIIRTAELEGHVVTTDGIDEQPVSRALIRLETLDGELVAQTRSAFDGFYVFYGVEQGVYQVLLEEPLETRLLNRPDNVTVVTDSGIIRELDFTLRAIKTQPIVLEELLEDETLQQ